METFRNQMVIALRIFKGMGICDNLDMEKVSSRLRYAFLVRKIPYQKAAREMGIRKEIIFRYTDPDYPEELMQPEFLIQFADYLSEEKYYFCSEYHKFLDVVDGGSFLLKVRKKNNMTQKQFADHLGIPLANYKYYERKKGRVPKKVFDQLRDEADPLLP